MAAEIPQGMGGPPGPRVGNSRQARLPLAVEEPTPSATIYEVDPQACFLSRIFVVPKVPTGWRLILDVSALNEYIVIPSFKMSNHASLRQALSPPVWLASLDLKDAHLHVPIRNMELSDKEPSQVSSSIVLEQAVFLQGSRFRLSHCSVVLQHTNGRSPGEYCLPSLDLIPSPREHETAVGSAVQSDSLCCSGKPLGPPLHASLGEPSLVRYAVDRDQKVNKVHPVLLASLKPWL